MKKSWLDFFRREYQIRLSVSGQDVTGPLSEQFFGISVNTPAGSSVFRDDAGDAGNKSLSMLKELHPGVLRIDSSCPDAACWLDFCLKEEIHPHLVFPADADPSGIHRLVEGCLSDFTENELWSPVRFYELTVPLEEISFNEEQILADHIREIKEKAEMIRSLDPQGRIILGGIAPMGNARGRAEIRNPMLLVNCRHVMDMISIIPELPVDPESIPDMGSEGIEINAALAEEIRLGLARAERQILEAAPDSGIRIAVTGWHYLKGGEAQKRQDCVFFASVITAIRSFPSVIALNEAGPLFGREGLLSFENGTIYGNVFYCVLLIASRSLPVGLGIRETEQNKNAPVYLWEGIPGILDGRKISLLEAEASRSTDGKRLCLFLTNRSPFKQAVARIRFLDFPDMHPAEALSLRSGTILDENSASAPEKVYCKKVRLKKYRNMNHVTLEIPECSTVWVLLDTGFDY